MSSPPMAADLGGAWTTVLDILSSFVMPDWASVVSGLLPIGLALLVVLGAALLARAWFRAWREDPARLARRRRRSIRAASRPPSPAAAIGRWLLLLPLGALVAGAGLLDRSLHPSGNLVLLLAGLAIGLLGVGLSVRASEGFAEGRGAATTSKGPGLAARLAATRASFGRLPRPLRRLPPLAVAAIVVVCGLLFVPAPTEATGRPVANLPLLLAGLALGLAVVAQAVRDWERFDPRS